MSNSNLATFSAPSAATVRPRETTNGPTERSHKATRIKIGGHTVYPYETMAVMGNRGYDEPAHGKRDSFVYSTHARPLAGHDTRISENVRKGTFGNTDTQGNLG